MDVSHEQFEHHDTESPLPPTANHWVPLALPLIALLMGLMFVGIMLFTQR